MDFSQSLHRMNLDVSLFACLTALVIITGEALLTFKRRLLFNGVYDSGLYFS